MGKHSVLHPFATHMPICHDAMMNHEAPNDQAIWRIIDANRNRATEACRVIEEYCRFQIDSTLHAGTAKELRHSISAVVSQLAQSHGGNVLLVARDTAGDVGTTIDADDEFAKKSIDELLAANFSRLQQSLRSLEEYSKLMNAEAAKKMESARYESYKLEKRLNSDAVTRERLADCKLCVLIDATDSKDNFSERVSMLVDAGAHMIQLREKKMDSRELVERARIAKRICRESGALLIVNDRPDICLLSDADGVHVGQADFSVRDARKIVASRIVGVSTHSLEQAQQAEHDGADYIGIGPVFLSTTKSFDESKGCELLAEVSKQVSLPGFAIGGIDLSNVNEVIESGVHRIAVSGALSNTAKPSKVLQELLEALD